MGKEKGNGKAITGNIERSVNLAVVESLVYAIANFDTLGSTIADTTSGYFELIGLDVKFQALLCVYMSIAKTTGSSTLLNYYLQYPHLLRWYCLFLKPECLFSALRAFGGH